MTGKQAEAQARVCVRTRSTLITSNQGGLLFLLVPEGVVFIHSPAVSEGYIYVRHALLVVSGLALCEWGFNWDLPSFRVVLCLRCLVSLCLFGVSRLYDPIVSRGLRVCVEIRRNVTCFCKIPLSVKSYKSACIAISSRQARLLHPPPRPSKMTAMVWEDKMNANKTRLLCRCGDFVGFFNVRWSSVCAPLLGQQPCARESTAGMDGALIDQICRPAPL